jgi:hypothetical protein
MSKASEKLAEKTEARDFLVSKWGQRIADGKTLVECRTEYGTGEIDYVSVHIYSTDESTGRINTFNLTPYIARAWGYRMRKSNTKFQLAIGGGGVSKAYVVALNLFQLLGIEHRETDINFTY